LNAERRKRFVDNGIMWIRPQIRIFLVVPCVLNTIKENDTMEKTLFNTKKYNGMYVAIKDPNNPVVIASGHDPAKVYSQAQQKGCNDPTIIYVPAEESVHIY
jgi:hypothetical protein